MNSFQNIVMGVAIFLLILCLIVISYSLYNKQYQLAYPPVVADCPDYWLDKSDGNSSKCVNDKGLGKMNRWCKGPMDFSHNFWLGESGLDRKKAWAKYCKLQWDGVTNTDLPRSSSLSTSSNNNNCSKDDYYQCSTDETDDTDETGDNYDETDNFWGIEDINNNTINSGDGGDGGDVGDVGNPRPMIGGKALPRLAPITSSL